MSIRVYIYVYTYIHIMVKLNVNFLFYDNGKVRESFAGQIACIFKYTFFGD